MDDAKRHELAWWILEEAISKVREGHELQE